MQNVISSNVKVSQSAASSTASRTLSKMERMHALTLAGFSTASKALVDFLEPFEAANALDNLLSRVLEKARNDVAVNTAH